MTQTSIKVLIYLFHTRKKESSLCDIIKGMRITINLGRRYVAV